MANIWGRPEIKLKIALELNEEEARALLTISEFGIDTLLKVFYTHMGARVVDEHKKGIVSLFETVRQPLSQWIDKVNSARKTFEAK